MHTIKLSLKQNKFPTAADFKDKPPPNRSEIFKERWTRITTGCKEKLSLPVLEDLNEKYQNTKTEIQTQLALLQQSSNTQFTEITTFLQEKYKSTMPRALTRNNKKLDRARKLQRQNNKGPRPRPFKKANRREECNQDTKKLLAALLKTLK